MFNFERFVIRLMRSKFLVPLLGCGLLLLCILVVGLSGRSISTRDDLAPQSQKVLPPVRYSEGAFLELKKKVAFDLLALQGELLSVLVEVDNHLVSAEHLDSKMAKIQSSLNALVARIRTANVATHQSGQKTELLLKFEEISEKLVFTRALVASQDMGLVRTSVYDIASLIDALAIRL